MSPRNVPISMAPKVPSRGGTSGGAGILVTVALVDIGYLTIYGQITAAGGEADL